MHIYIKTLSLKYYCHYKLCAHYNDLTSLFLFEQSVTQPPEPTACPQKTEQVIKALILLPFAVYLETNKINCGQKYRSKYQTFAIKKLILS